MVISKIISEFFYIKLDKVTCLLYKTADAVFQEGDYYSTQTCLNVQCCSL